MKKDVLLDKLLKLFIVNKLSFVERNNILFNNQLGYFVVINEKETEMFLSHNLLDIIETPHKNISNSPVWQKWVIKGIIEDINKEVSKI